MTSESFFVRGETEMKNSIKTAFIAAVAVAGIAACTSTPVSQQNTTTTTTPAADSATPSTSVVTEVVTSTVTNPPKPQSATKVDNRVGYGALKLGMTLEEVRATGLVSPDFGAQDSGDCWSGERVSVSKKYGVVRVSLPAGAKTSTGIGVGSTAGEVRRAHPGASEYRAGLSAALGDSSFFAFLMTSRKAEQVADTDRVDHIKIVARVTDCAMADL